MGEVYRARDPRLRRDVAIKVLATAVSTDLNRLRRFEQEARAAAALNHPNILAIHDFGTHNGIQYVVSELLVGQTLREALSGGSLPASTTIDYAIQIAGGLAAAHDQGVVHRDLKPENLFVTRDGRVKILDFGLAKLTGSAPAAAAGSIVATRIVDTMPGTVLGTVGYMSPEQAHRYFFARRGDVRNALGPPPVLRGVGHRDDERDRHQGSARPLVVRRIGAGRADADRQALPRQEAGGPLRVGARSRVRARQHCGR